jgi:hypothetical protein
MCWHSQQLSWQPTCTAGECFDALTATCWSCSEYCVHYGMAVSEHQRRMWLDHDGVCLLRLILADTPGPYGRCS